MLILWSSARLSCFIFGVCNTVQYCTDPDACVCKSRRMGTSAGARGRGEKGCSFSSDPTSLLLWNVERKIKRWFKSSSGFYWRAKRRAFTRRQPRKRWACADPKTKPLLHSAGCPVENKTQDEMYLFIRVPYTWTSCCRNSPHWEPCHVCRCASFFL